MGALTEITGYLLQTVLSLLLMALMLRLLLQVVRADFYNPISQMLVKVTNPLVAPVRRIVPGLWGVDMATLVLLVLVQLAGIAAMLLLNGYALPNPILMLVWSLIGICALTVQFFFFALLGMIILSWIAPGSSHPAVHLLYQITEPVMSPCRKVLPPMGGLDLSPIALFIGINILQIALRHAAASVGLPTVLVLGL
jgi:YggT family protein